VGGWTGVGIMCGRMDWSGDDVCGRVDWSGDNVWEDGLEWG
jgi:hypothetical protein